MSIYTTLFEDLVRHLARGTVDGDQVVRFVRAMRPTRRHKYRRRLLKTARAVTDPAVRVRLYEAYLGTTD